VLNNKKNIHAGLNISLESCSVAEHDSIPSALAEGQMAHLSAGRNLKGKEDVGAR
jgi:hypothetical protein